MRPGEKAARRQPWEAMLPPVSGQFLDYRYYRPGEDIGVEPGHKIIRANLIDHALVEHPAHLF